MLRASSIYNICTNRRTFDAVAYESKISEFKTKVEKKGLDFDLSNLDLYLKTDGLITISKAIKSLEEKKLDYELDPLPDGAISYIERAWFESEKFHTYSNAILSEQPHMLKGTIMENDAINVLNRLWNTSLVKNSERIEKEFLTGECDILDRSQDLVIDIKTPKDHLSFKEKKGIPSEYYWQLRAYQYLYGVKRAKLVYVLMPTPLETLPRLNNLSEQVAKDLDITNKLIEELEDRIRVKVYEMPQETLKSDILFMLSRLEKSASYYQSLTKETIFG